MVWSDVTFFCVTPLFTQIFLVQDSTFCGLPDTSVHLRLSDQLLITSRYLPHAADKCRIPFKDWSVFYLKYVVSGLASVSPADDLGNEVFT